MAARHQQQIVAEVYEASTTFEVMQKEPHANPEDNRDDGSNPLLIDFNFAAHAETRVDWQLVECERIGKYSQTESQRVLRMVWSPGFSRPNRQSRNGHGNRKGGPAEAGTTNRHMREIP